MKTNMFPSVDCVNNTITILGENPMNKNQNILINKHRKRKQNESYI